MNSRRYFLNWSLVVVLLFLSTTASGADFSYNQAATEADSSNMIRGEGHIADFNGPTLDAIDSQQILEADHVQPGGTHDWGKDAVGAATLGTLAASGDAFVTLDQLSANEIKVRASSDALASGIGPPPNGGRADGLSVVLFNMTIDLNNLTPGGLYNIAYNWEVEAAAGGPNAFNFGGSSTSGDMQIVNMGPPINIFNETVSGNPDQPLVQINPSGSGSFNFIAPGPVFQMVLSMHLNSGAQAVLSGGAEDLIGSTFYGEATFTIHQVPEPSTFVLFAITTSLVGLRRHREWSGFRNIKPTIPCKFDENYRVTAPRMGCN